MLGFLLPPPYASVAAAATTSATCSDNSEAANASVELKWEQPGSSDVYTRIAHTSEPLVSPSTSRHRLVTIGGIEYESAQPVVTNPVLVYDVAANTFAAPSDHIQSSVATSAATPALDEVFTSPASRSDHASFVDTSSNAVYVFGGQNREFLNDTWRLCLDDTGSTTAVWDQLTVLISDAATSDKNVPAPRIGHSFTKVFENSSAIGAIVYGGLSDAYAELDGLHLAIISKTTMTSTCSSKQPTFMWRKLAASPLVAGGPVPLARAYHSATTSSRLFDVAARSSRNVCLLVFGGKSASTTTETTSAQGSTIFDELWRLCPPLSASGVPVVRQTYTWELLSPVGTTPGARYGASIAFVEEGKFALAGGSAAFPSDYLSDSWELNVNASQWVQLRFTADLSSPRRGHSLAYFSGASSSYLLVMGGRDRCRVVETRIESANYIAPSCAAGLTITRCGSTYVCVPCPAGAFLQDGTRNCAACPAGTYSSADAASKCTPCPTGTYSPVTGLAGDSSAVCLACPAGTASNALGATSLTACASCATGSFASLAESSACTPCPVGMFASGRGALTCSQCSSGTYASSTGSPSCASCPAGTYAPATNGAGATTCHDCPRGFFSDQASSLCSPCPTNSSSAVIAASGASSCALCAAQRGFTPLTLIGQTECSYCPPGSALVTDAGSIGQCQSCPVGYYSAGAATGGACVACPRNSYAPTSGLSACIACPPGAFTSTTSGDGTGATTCDFCVEGSFFDGVACRPCGAGWFPSVSQAGVCSTCLTGTSSSSSWSTPDDTETAATPSIGCPACPRMKYTASRGAITCNECVGDSIYDAFTMDGWRSCISCRVSADGGLALSGCALGRNGVMCSGNGECVYGGCACATGWAGGDCSVPVAALSSSSPSSTAAQGGNAVLYIASPRYRVIAAPVPNAGSITVNVQVARAGDSSVSLTAAIACKGSNLSVAAASVLTPATTTVQLAPGESSKNVSVTIGAAALLSRAGCRSVTLELRDVGASTTSAVSIEADRELVVYVDDMNSERGGSAITTATYQRREDGVYVASVTLDRLLSSTVTLQPDSTAGSNDLYKQRLNVLLAIDPSAEMALTFVDLLPAVFAKLQRTYTLLPGGIRLGVLTHSTPTAAECYAENVSNAFDRARDTLAVAASNASATEYAGLSQWLTDALASADSSTTWPSKDRRLIIAVGDGLFGPIDGNGLVSVPGTLQSSLHKHGSFAFLLTSKTLTLPASATSVVGTVTYDASDSILQRVAQAFIAKDAALPSAVDIAADASSMLQNGGARIVSFSGSGHTLPVLSVTFAAFPSASPNASLSVTISVPGVVRLLEELTEPKSSCSAPVVTKPADPHPMSGWMGPWDLMSDDEIRSMWKPSSPTLAIGTRQETSLLRGYNNSILTLADSSSTGFSATRTLPGSSFAAGLPVILRGYWRLASLEGHANASDGRAECKMSLQTLGDAPSSRSVTFSADPTVDTNAGGVWTYGHLRHAIPSGALDAVKLTLECSTSSMNTRVDWTTLGLFPDPAFACQCPRGYYYQRVVSTAPNTTSSIDEGVCMRCLAGSYCAAGIKSQCPTGSFSFGEAATCEACRDGWICIGGMARLCDPGTYATAASACGACPSGYACRNGKKVACPPGTFSPALAGDCFSCPPGTFSQSEASGTCAACPSGATSNHQRDHCVTCGAGEWAVGGSGQHPCASCAITRFYPQGALVREVCVDADGNAVS